MHAGGGSCDLQRRVRASSHWSRSAVFSVRVTASAIPLWEAAEEPLSIRPASRSDLVIGVTNTPALLLLAYPRNTKAPPERGFFESG